MGQKSKNKLCKVKKELLKHDLEEFKELVKSPNYLCKKCGRVSNEEQYVCKAVSL